MKTAALVLSGGGGLGLAHVGALRVLENQYTFNYYAGVSAGAIVSAAHSCGYSAAEISEIVHDINFFSLAFDRSQTNFGLVQGEKVFALLEGVFQKKTFEELEKENIALRLYATDFQTGERVCLRSGSIAKAVMASISVPILFDPLEYNGRFLVDGGLSGNFPMEETLEQYEGQCMGIDVATSLNSDINFGEKSWFGKPKGLQQTLERTFRILFKNQQSFNVNNPKIEKIITPNLTAFKTIDILKLKEIEKAGEESVLKEHIS